MLTVKHLKAKLPAPEEPVDGPDFAYDALYRLVQRLPDGLRVGLEKGCLGNTSVTFGAVNQAEAKGTRAGVFNVGGANIRLQVYKRDDEGDWVVEKEIKPEAKCVFTTATVAEIRGFVDRELPEHKEVPCLCLVTGDARRDPERFEEKARRAFGDRATPACGDRFVLAHASEARLELVAARAMYRKLWYQVPDACLGVGSTTTNASKASGEVLSPEGLFWGMKNKERVSDEDLERIAAFLRTGVDVLALKSGLLLSKARLSRLLP